MDDPDDLSISVTCAYCGETLASEWDEPEKGVVELVVEWDHVCTTPPPIIMSLLPGEDDE